MQQLASGVGDLKRVLTQVKPRGVWGEVQLGSLLEDFLAPDQFARNVAVRADSQERVEFAIRLPRLGDGHSEVYLPIDCKFPHENFERIVAAADAGDAVSLEDAARALERAVRLQAKDISSKYIVPPNTTDYAIMFLPSEALYAEVARRPGLVEAMTRESAIMIAGPSTLTALLNAIRVGFRSALIHRQAGEISKLLQLVRSEFEKYGKAVQTVYDRATSTVTAIDRLKTRQNVMGKALKGVDLLSADSPVDAAAMLLEFETQSPGTGDDEETLKNG
jgi:DNA recombination protein RmuC